MTESEVKSISYMSKIKRGLEYHINENIMHLECLSIEILKVNQAQLCILKLKPYILWLKEAQRAVYLNKF